jgi:DNA-binding transcriptional ArsR family regulator
MNIASLERKFMFSMVQYSSEFCSRRLKAIADPTRWAVLIQLTQAPKTVAELNLELGLDPTLLSHHLKTLREEELVECATEGKNRRYRLARSVQLDPSGQGLDLGCCRLELKDGPRA